MSVCNTLKEQETNFSGTERRKNDPATATEEGMHDRYGQDQKGIIAYMHCSVCVGVYKGHAAATPRAL